MPVVAGRVENVRLELETRVNALIDQRHNTGGLTDATAFEALGLMEDLIRVYEYEGTTELQTRSNLSRVRQLTVGVGVTGEIESAWTAPAQTGEGSIRYTGTCTRTDTNQVVATFGLQTVDDYDWTGLASGVEHEIRISAVDALGTVNEDRSAKATPT